MHLKRDARSCEPNYLRVARIRIQTVDAANATRTQEGVPGPTKANSGLPALTRPKDARDQASTSETI